MNRLTSWQLLEIFVVSLSVAGVATAAPSITSVEEVPGERGVFVITGSGFGAGPRVVMFDNFNKFDNNMVSFLGAEVGEWFQINDTPIAENEGFGGGHAAQIITELPDGSQARNSFAFAIPDQNAPNETELFQEVYFSYAIKDLGNFPGDGGTESSFSTRSSSKDAWMMLGHRGDQGNFTDDYYVGNDLVVTTWTGTGFSVAGNNTNLRPRFTQRDLRENWVFQGWNQYFFHAKINPDDSTGPAEGFFGFSNANTTLFNVRDGGFMSDTTKAPYWDRIKFGPWHNTGNGGVNRLLDHVYIAYGPSAAARVVIADSDQLETVTRMYHGIPTSWDGDRISVDFSYSTGRSAGWYLYVINARNEFSNPIGLTCDICPESPSGFEEISN